METVPPRRIWRTALAGALSAAFVFWAPSVLLHAFSPNFGALGEPLILAVILPLLVLVTSRVLRRDRPRAFVISALAGIGFLGPACMMLSGTFTGGGFCDAGSLKVLLLLTMGFPVITPMMSAYDGTMFGLALTSAYLARIAIIPPKGRREPSG